MPARPRRRCARSRIPQTARRRCHARSPHVLSAHHTMVCVITRVRVCTYASPSAQAPLPRSPAQAAANGRANFRAAHGGGRTLAVADITAVQPGLRMLQHLQGDHGQCDLVGARTNARSPPASTRAALSCVSAPHTSVSCFPPHPPPPAPMQKGKGARQEAWSVWGGDTRLHFGRTRGGAQSGVGGGVPHHDVGE